jgi:hypothetical protein
VYFDEIKQTFRRNILPTSSGSKIGSRKKVTCFHVGFLLGLFFDLEDIGDMFFKIFRSFSTDHTELYRTAVGTSNPARTLVCQVHFLFQD